MKKYSNLGNVVIIILTIVFFGISLFLTGFTHDLLLEIGVLLVSVKLIMMNSKMSAANIELQNKLDEMKTLLEKLQSK